MPTNCGHRRLTRAAKSNERIAALDVSVAEANARAAEADKKAEEERLARVQIEARLAPRLLAGTDHVLFVKRMSALKGTQADLTMHGSAGEITDIGHSVLDALREAGWDMAAASMTSAAPVRGIIVDTTPPNVSIGPLLVDTLNAVGLVSNLQPGASQEIDHFGGLRSGIPGARQIKSSRPAPIRIIIGAKP